MWATPTPAPTLTWKPLHGGYRGTSRDREREYWIQPVMVGADSPGPVKGWWAVTTSADVTVRKLIRSREGAMQLAERWEADPSRIG